MKLKMLIIPVFLISGLIYGEEMSNFLQIYENYSIESSKELINDAEKFIDNYSNSYLKGTAGLMNACVLYEKGSYEQAEKILLECKETVFENEVKYLMVSISLKKNNIENATSIFEKMEKNSIYYYFSAAQIGEYYEKKLDFNWAIDHYKMLLPSKEFENYANGKLAVNYYKNFEFNKASNIFDIYLKNNLVKDNKFLYAAGYSYKRNGEKEKALNEYKKILNEEREDEIFEKTLYETFLIYTELKDLKEAEKCLERMNYEFPFKETAMIQYAEMLKSMKNFREAESILKKAYAYYNSNAAAISLINSYIIKQEYNKALDSLGIISDDIRYLYYKIYLLYKEKQYKEVLNLETLIFQQTPVSYKFNEIMIFSAESFYKEKMYSEASILLNNIKLENIDIELKKDIIFRKIKIEIAEGNEKEVKDLYENSKKLFFKDNDYYKSIVSNIGTWYESQKKYRDAELIYKEYLKSYSSDYFTKRLVLVLFNNGKYNEAEKAAEKLISGDDSDYLKGISSFANRNYFQSEKIFQQMYERSAEPKEEILYFLLMSKYNLEKYKEYLQLSQNYVDRFGKRKEELLLKDAMAYFKILDYQNAIYLFSQVNEESANRDYALFMIGEVYFNIGDYEKAIIAYKKIEQFKNSKYLQESIYWLGNIFYQQNDIEKAKFYYEKYLNDYGFDNADDVVFNLGNIYEGENAIDKAIENYSTLIDKTNRKDLKIDLIKKIVEVYMTKEDYKNAEKWIEKIEIVSQKTLLRAKWLEKQNKKDEALGLFLELSTDPEHKVEAFFYLGNHYFVSKEYEKAREYLKKVVEAEVADNKEKAQMIIGESYDNEAKFDKAIENYTFIMKKFPNSNLKDKALFKIAEDYEKLINKKMAIKYYKEIFSDGKESEYYELALTRLLDYALSDKENAFAKIYYAELERINSNAAKVYKDKITTGGESSE